MRLTIEIVMRIGATLGCSGCARIEISHESMSGAIARNIG